MNWRDVPDPRTIRNLSAWSFGNSWSSGQLATSWAHLGTIKTAQLLTCINPARRGSKRMGLRGRVGAPVYNMLAPLSVNSPAVRTVFDRVLYY